MTTATPAKAITQVSKSNPCPHCGNTDWCYSLGELTACKRSYDPANGWEKTSKSDRDGTPYYAPFSPKKETRAKAKTEFIYHDRNGRPCVKVTRSDDGNGKKDFYQASWDGKNWVKGLSGDARKSVPVYRYTEVREAIASGKQIFCVEGEGVADLLWSMGIPATTTLGGSKAYRKYGEYSSDLEDAQLVLCPDRDKPGIAYMAEVAKDYPQAKWLYTFPNDYFWANLSDSGGLDIADWVKSGITSEQIMNSITDRILLWERLLNEIPDAPDSPPEPTERAKADRVPPANIIAGEIAKTSQDKWAWNNEHKSWMSYGQKYPGIWSAVDNRQMEAEIQSILETRGIVGYSGYSYVSDTCKLLGNKLFAPSWDERQGVLPFEDGLAVIESGEFEEHSPDNRLTWCLPRRYETPIVSDWGKIRAWMNEAWSNPHDREILIHFMAATLKGLSYLQKFLYLVGSGGAGKGTYTRLLQAVIGDRNVWAGQIESLSNSNETFRLVGKRLAVFSDQDKVTGGMQLFKNLTGGDTMSAKQLYKDGFNFNFDGLAVVTANAPALMGAGSWMKRRAVVVSCNYQAAVERDLDAEFEPEIAAFTRYLLSISTKDIERVLRDQRPTSGTVDAAMWEVMQRQDSIAAWIEEHVKFDPNFSTAIGTNKNENQTDLNFSSLFGSYHSYCSGAGQQGKSLNNFSAELEEMCQKVLGIKFVFRHKKKTGRVMIGVSLRQKHEPSFSETLITPLSDEEVTTKVTAGDDQGDDQGDDLKPLICKEGDGGDDLFGKKPIYKNERIDSEAETQNNSLPELTIGGLGRHQSSPIPENTDTATVTVDGEVVTQVVTQVVTRSSPGRHPENTAPTTESSAQLSTSVPESAPPALKVGDRVTNPTVDIYEAVNGLTGTVQAIISPRTCRIKWVKTCGATFTSTEDLADLRLKT